MNLKTKILNWITTIVGSVVSSIAMLGFFEVIPSTLVFNTVVQMLCMVSGVFLIFSRW